jgi:hypothetical protein
MQFRVLPPGVEELGLKFWILGLGYGIRDSEFEVHECGVGGRRQKRQDKTRQDKTRQDKTRQDKTRQGKEKGREKQRGEMTEVSIPKCVFCGMVNVVCYLERSICWSAAMMEMSGKDDRAFLGSFSLCRSGIPNHNGPEGFAVGFYHSIKAASAAEGKVPEGRPWQRGIESHSDRNFQHAGSANFPASRPRLAA